MVLGLGLLQFCPVLFFTGSSILTNLSYYYCAVCTIHNNISNTLASRIIYIFPPQYHREGRRYGVEGRTGAENYSTGNDGPENKCDV